MVQFQTRNGITRFCLRWQFLLRKILRIRRAKTRRFGSSTRPVLTERRLPVAVTPRFLESILARERGRGVRTY
jgi:hypothetical protein